jgi:hypothetical protein
MHGSRVVPALIGCIISVLSFDIRSICAAEQGPKVVVDSWWSGAGCDECAYRLQDSVMSQIAIDPSCHGITVTRAYGPEDKNGEAILPALSRWWRQSGGKPHWMLLIDYIGSAYWQLFYQEDIDKIGESGIIPGEYGDKAAKIAHDACAIILQRGGTIIR